MVRRILLAPLLAVAMLLSIAGAVAVADEMTGPVEGEVRFSKFDVVAGPEAIDGTALYRDEAVAYTRGKRAENYLVLPSGDTVRMSSTTQITRVFNDAFFAYFYAGDYARGDWSGYAYATQTLALGKGVTCMGRAVFTFEDDYQAPGLGRYVCNDGGRLLLHFEGSSELLGTGYDDISGYLRY